MRSVVLKPAVRCERCRLPPRWCVCAVQRELSCPLQIDVLMHHRERFRPSSTGNLINRIFPTSRLHLWRRERQITADEIKISGRELWLLHPQGEEMPAEVAPENLQVVLLDGSWREASAMAQEIRGWGRMVSLPMQGASRYWLREQSNTERFSTAEALMFLLGGLGLQKTRHEFNLQFELHVYASLRSRGSKEAALAFLATSPIATAFPEFIAELDVSRPL